MATIRTLSEPRSTAYYYGDLERLKRTQDTHRTPDVDPPRNELSEYLESNEVFNEAPVSEVPPLRDRPFRQYSLPEYHTPENSRKIAPSEYHSPEGSRKYPGISGYNTPDGPRKFPGADYRTPETSRNPGETYSTAGTFPMPKEKEPLLAELEIVGRLPLTQLDSGSGVRRSRSWYLCCPNVEEEMSRESSWRYSSLRPVTAPPVPRNGIGVMLATQSSTQDEATTIRLERDSLARTLAAERQRAAAAARAHDARLAELHGVIAELMRRRERDQSSKAIPEEDTSERSDECESTTQPAEELDNDADKSPTDQNDSSSMLSPAEVLSPADTPSVDPPPISCEIGAAVGDSESISNQEESSDKHSERCLSTARCCQYSLETHSGGGRSHRSRDDRRLAQPASPGSFRQAKLASRVRLRRTEDSLTNAQISINDDAWCAEAAEKLALDVAAQADLREAMVTANSDASALQASLLALRAHSARLEADARVAECAYARAADTAHRLATACAVHESSTVALCSALLAADRALEAYDVLLALAETQQHTQKRSEAELVAQQLLTRLNCEAVGATIGEPLLSPGPWLLHNPQSTPTSPWTEECERDLRSHAARLKSETATLRVHRPPAQLFSYHDEESEEQPKPVNNVSMADMEAAVMMQEVLLAREERACALAALATERARVTALTRALGDRADTDRHKTGSARSRGRHTTERDRHWLAPPSETEL